MSIFPQDNERLKLFLLYGFGYFIVTVYATDALVFAIRDIQEKSSFGLREMLEALKPLGTLWAGFVFRGIVEKANNKEQ